MSEHLSLAIILDNTMVSYIYLTPIQSGSPQNKLPPQYIIPNLASGNFMVHKRPADLETTQTAKKAKSAQTPSSSSTHPPNLPPHLVETLDDSLPQHPIHTDQATQEDEVEDEAFLDTARTGPLYGAVDNAVAHGTQKPGGGPPKPRTKPTLTNRMDEVEASLKPMQLNLEGVNNTLKMLVQAIQQNGIPAAHGGDDDSEEQTPSPPPAAPRQPLPQDTLLPSTLPMPLPPATFMPTSLPAPQTAGYQLYNQPGPSWFAPQTTSYYTVAGQNAQMLHALPQTTQPTQAARSADASLMTGETLHNPIPTTRPSFLPPPISMSTQLITLPISEKNQAKILAGHYVDFSELSHPNKTQTLTPSIIQTEYGNYAIPPQNPQRKKDKSRPTIGKRPSTPSNRCTPSVSLRRLTSCSPTVTSSQP